MKKLILLFIALLSLSYQAVQAQACLQGVPNPAVWGTIDDFSIGFTIDANPLDVDTAQVVQGQDTVIYIQYLLPKKQAITSPITGTATVTSITILGVSGLPIGMAWSTDAAAFANNNTYNPQTYRYGCVSLCGETFAAPGIYTIVVNIQGCGSLSGLTACDAQTTNLYLEVLPGSGSGPIQMTPPVACNSATVVFDTDVFSSDLVLNPEEYIWTFHDATTQTGKPVSKTYSTPGNYPVKLTRNIYEYYVSAASVSVSGGYTGDIEELFGGQADPYLLINGGNGSITTSTVNDDNTSSWTGLDVPISAYSISINAWDEDNGPPFGSADDNLGTATISYTSLSPGLVLGYTSSNFTGTITISQRINTTLVEWDTVKIQANTVANTITANNGFTFCSGDSTILNAGTGFSYYQWYDDNGSILNANAQTLELTSPGNYFVEVVAINSICSGFSDTVSVSTVSVSASNIQAMGGFVYVDNSSGFNLQWYADNVLIANETNDTLSANALAAGGSFTVRFTNAIGCEVFSSAFTLCIAGSSSSNGSLVSFTGNTIDFTAENFVVNPGNIIAWAVSTAANGPITNQNDLQTAIANGWVFPSDQDSSINLSCGDVALANGDYIMTPFTAEALVIDPIYWDVNEAATCNANMTVCISLSGSNYQVSPLELVLPNGDTIDVIGELAGGLIPPGTPIDPTLWGIATSQFGNPVCIDLISILQYTDDPNGTWSFILPNAGTGALNFTIADFDIVVLADSCNQLAADQITSVSGISGSVNPGATGVFSITVPPLPANFPNIAADCETFGSATPFTVYCTDTNIVILTPDTITFQVGTIIVDSNGDTTVLTAGNSVTVAAMDSFYIIDNGVATVYVNDLANPIIIVVNGVMIYIIETTNITAYVAPTIVPECEAGFATSDSVVVSFNGGTTTLTAEDFVLLNGNSVAWAFSTEANGPITDMTGLQAAISAGLVVPGDNDTLINISCSDINLANGAYYATPFTAQSALIDTSISWNPIDVACTPQINLCIGLSGTGWEINPLLMVLPTGDTLDVIATLAAGIVPPGTPINAGLWGLATSQLGDPACLELVSMLGFNDNPNGTWQMILPNTGTGALNIELSGMSVVVEADSCSQIANDLVYNIPGISTTINTGTTQTLSFTIDLPQPPPANFPNIVSNCDVIGDAVLFTVYCNDTSTGTPIREINTLGAVNIYPNPNTGIFNVSLDLKEAGTYNLSMFDMLGRSMSTQSFDLPVGKTMLPMNASVFSKGLYHLVIENAGVKEAFKVVLK